MRCFKLLGERSMARDFYLHVAKLQTRAAILIRFTAHGTPEWQLVATTLSIQIVATVPIRSK